MGLFKLYHSGKSIKFIKGDSTVLSAKLPPALGVTEALSYDWQLTVTASTIVLSFIGAKKDMKWIYSVTDLAEKKFIELSIEEPTFLPRGVNFAHACLIAIVIAGFVFLAGMLAGHSAAITAFTENPSRYDFRFAYESAIKHHEQDQKKTSLTVLNPEFMMTEKNMLCNPNMPNDCIKIQNCALVHVTETLIVGNWVPDGGKYRPCHLMLQADGNLVMYTEGRFPVLSSATNEQDCTKATYADNQFRLHCSGKTITWEMTKSK